VGGGGEVKKYNQEAAEKTLAAYETSTDYDLLYKLAKQGYNIPCFLWSDLFTNGDTLFFSSGELLLDRI
jgi:hypothetical protein